MTLTEERSAKSAAQPRVSARRVLARHGYTWGLLGLALLVALVFSLVNSSVYATSLNVQSVAYSIPEVALMALAISIAMTVAGIDLSTVAVANLAALFIAWFSSAGEQWGLGAGATTVVAVAGALVIGGLCGLLNGIVISRLKVAPILTTLATMQVFTGLALAMTRGEASYGVTEPLADFGFNSFLGVPLVFWAFVGVALVVWAVMTQTSFGLKATMMGANRVASEYSGTSHTWVVTRAYMLTGLISALAGVILVSRTESASAGYGSSYLMLAITIAVLGGANPFGGRVAIVGAALAAVVLQLIASGLNMLGVSTYIYQVVQGLILVGVFVFALEQRNFRRLIERWRLRAGVPDSVASETTGTKESNA